MMSKEFLEKIQSEVLDWSMLNFGDQSPDNPLLGIAEEIGELFHAHLKGIQGIRHSPEKIILMKKDALADILIYILDYTGRVGVKIDLTGYDHYPGLPGGSQSITLPNEILKSMMISLGRVYEADTSDDRYDVVAHINTLVYSLNLYAEHYGWNLTDIVDEIWKIVGGRNWQRSR